MSQLAAVQLMRQTLIVSMNEADDRNRVVIKGAGEAAARARCKQPDRDVYLSREHYFMLS